MYFQYNYRRYDLNKNIKKKMDKIENKIQSSFFAYEKMK